MGFDYSLRQIKKLCGKQLFSYKGYAVWKDTEGYYYSGFNKYWNKRVKAEYSRFSLCRDTAVLVGWTEGIYGTHRLGWFESEQDWDKYWKEITSKQPSYAATLWYEVKKRGYQKLPVEDRKLIARLPYCDFEEELKWCHWEWVALRWWYKCEEYTDEEICKEIVRRIVEGKKEVTV